MDQEEQAKRRVGSTLCNKWTLEKLLGVGGMAAVYVANHKIGRQEAIKILHPDMARSPELRARFEQEAHAANRFQHPGAVEIRDIDTAEDGTPFLVMELLHGESLSARAGRLGGIALDELYRLMDELLDVLAAAHAQGIIHRDVKLDNLFVKTDGALKVLDFGIARIRDGLPKRLRTRVGAALGTTPYMPPEQIKGLSVDARADLFAVGATMFRLIARRRLHEAENEADLAVKMASVPAPALCSVAPDAPRDTGLVVDRALMFRRDLRYPDARTMQTDMRALRANAPPPYATARLFEPDPPPEPVSPHTPWVTGEIAESLPERTAAASPGALAEGGTAEGGTPEGALATGTIAKDASPAPGLVEPATVVHGARAKPANAPESAIGVEASLVMPPPDLGADVSAKSAAPAPSMLEPVPVRIADTKPPPTADEPTLKSPGGVAVATTAPPAIQVVSPPVLLAPRRSPALRPTLPEVGIAGARPSLPRRRDQIIKLIFVAAFFLLLGVTLTLAWALSRRPRGVAREPGQAASDRPNARSKDGSAERVLGATSGVPIGDLLAPVKGVIAPPALTANPSSAPGFPARDGAPTGRGKGK